MEADLSLYDLAQVMLVIGFGLALGALTAVGILGALMDGATWGYRRARARLRARGRG